MAIVALLIFLGFFGALIWSMHWVGSRKWGAAILWFVGAAAGFQHASRVLGLWGQHSSPNDGPAWVALAFGFCYLFFGFMSLRARPTR
jgi:hypothetical protein